MKKILGISFFLLSILCFSQTPGQIYDDAANNTTNPMDPDGDGYVSASGAAWTVAETTELTFNAIPQVDPEPDNDIRTGSGCGATDVVDNPSTGAEASFVYFDDVNQIMVYRIRLSVDASGAFGYSVLVDTDGGFGFTGSSPDNNAVTGNPGFEFEIRYVTGATNLLYVDDVDGNNGSNGTDFSYDLDDNTQRAYALFNDADCGGDAVFYDFYIPLSSMGLTESSVIRLAAATSSNPSNSILSNPSDIAGIDDDDWADEDLAYIELINLQGAGTPVGNLGNQGCFLSGTSDTPTIFTPIFDSNSRVNGSSTEPEGAFLTVFTNGDTLGTTTTVGADGRWSVTFNQGDLRPFDEITAIARDSCENQSTASVKVNAINDLDSDNDGIPDSQEGNGVDPGGDADGDDIPNYLDTDYPGFVDANMDGINDNFDLDGDGIPSHFDPDANGDGLPDIDGAGGGALDSDNDGVIDEMEDTDGDGIPDIVDVDATGGTDSDNDGIDDAFDVDFTAGTDADGDGIDDATDPDDDNDGLYEGIDATEGGTPLTITDIDGDGILDYLDLDADGDGIPNSVEGSGDADGDGIPNHQDIDADGDGILDNIEAFTAAGYTAPSGNDTDGDGLDDAYDTDNGGTAITPVNTDGDANPDYLDVDSDGDGIGDFTESNDNNLNGIADVVDVLITGGLDVDMDGIDDTYDASVAVCTDNYNANDGTATSDGICDNIQNGGAPDTDGDGLADIYDSDNGGTPPVNQDTDGDGTPDYQDDDDDGDGIDTATEGTGFGQGGGTIPDYLYNPDFDGDGINDDVDLDSDNDGIKDAEEDGGTGYDPSGDADGDGILNYLDASDINLGFPAFTDANNDGINDAYDFDHDGIPDFKDRDSDGDGITDTIEAGGTDADGDGIVDGFDDSGTPDGIDDTIGTGGLSPVDTDSDGNDDYLDIDSDNDGIVDNVEGQDSSSYTAPTGNDSDRDGIDDAYDTDNGGSIITPVNTDGTGNPDYQDTDSDGDGINDIIEGHDANLDGEGDWDTNGNGIVEGLEGTGDADGDGLIDAFDTVSAPDDNNATGSNSFLGDTDGDGIKDFQDTDDDGDGVDTLTEGTNFDDGGEPIPDYLFNPDWDGDGLTDQNDADSDNDGIPDADEDGGTGFDPTADTDGDGILNYLDDNQTGLSFADVNNDGINDFFDFDLDGIPNFRDLESDGDGVYDIVEGGGTDSDNDGIADDLTDTDNDGYVDLFDSDNGGTALANPDSDGDGIPDIFDVDSDNDGLPDIIEYGGVDGNGDGRFDDLTDSDRDGIADAFDTDSGNGPLSPVDSDGDGLVDNAADLDSDGDGISDILEAGGVDADNDGVLDDLTDTDMDGLPDLVDTDNGGTPLTIPDTDGDGIRDYLDIDSDGDGIEDNIEAQTDAGYTAPAGADTDGDGIDNAYDPDNGGTALDPEDTDNDGTPDYQDTDSDGDGIADRIEGDDANADGVADSTASGTDTDGDGLDDTFDTDNGGTAIDPSNTDTDGDGAFDYRDTDDDGDGIATLDEPLDLNPPNGTPNYLENSVGSCGTGFVTTVFSGNADAVFAQQNTTNFAEALGASDGTGAEIEDVGDFLILDLTDEIPQNRSLSIQYASGHGAGMTMTLTSSINSGGPFADGQTLSTTSTGFVAGAYTVNTSGGIRYLRFELTTQNNGNATGDVDAVSYGFTQCDQDTDNDGTADFEDNDDDNDGIPDVDEGGGTDPSADADGDGIFNYEDTDFAGHTDVNGDGIDDNFDFDLDGIPNHMDLDADSDGIPDAIEANDGELPANMNSQGRYTIAYVQANDFDGDGHANEVDIDDGGTALPASDTDLDGSEDYLDVDSDGDGSPDYVEGFDDDGDGDALNDLLARAQAFETAAGDPGYYIFNDDNNGVDDGDGIPDWLEDSDSDGVPNFLDPDNSAYQDTDGDGLIDLFDTSSNGGAYTAPDGDSNGVPDYLQSGNIVTLPIELMYFEARLSKAGVEITWATATEIDNDFFNIERSLNGEDFASIAEIKGAGDSTEKLTYSFLDRNPISGVSYYRLKQTDYDGTFTYSDIVLVTNAPQSRVSLNLYPNPSSDRINLEFDQNLNVDGLKVRVISITGQELVSAEFDSDDEISVPIDHLPRGIYIVETNLGNSSWRMKLLKK